MASVTSISAHAHWISVTSSRSRSSSRSTSRWPRITSSPLTRQPTQVTSTSIGLVVVSDGHYWYWLIYVYLATLPAMSTTLGRSRGYRVTRGGKLVSSEIVPFSWKFKVSSDWSSSISSAVVCRLERVFRKLSRVIWPKSTDTLVAASRRERGSASSSIVESDASQCEFVILFIFIYRSVCTQCYAEYGTHL